MDQEPEPREEHLLAETCEEDTEEGQAVQTRDGDHAGQPKTGGVYPVLSE